MKTLLRRSWLVLDSIYRNLIVLGQLRSIMSGKAVDAKGNPIPWLNYAANDFIRDYIGGKYRTRVFEYGSGQSTIYFLNDNSVFYKGIETDIAYFNEMYAKHGCAYSSAVVCQPPPDLTAALLDQHDADLIIVDSDLENRPFHIWQAFSVMRDDAVLIVDDANWLDSEIQNILGRYSDDHPHAISFAFVSSAPCVSYQKSVAVIVKHPSALRPAGNFKKPVGGIDIPHGWVVGKI